MKLPTPPADLDWFINYMTGEVLLCTEQGCEVSRLTPCAIGWEHKHAYGSKIYPSEIEAAQAAVELHALPKSEKRNEG